MIRKLKPAAKKKYFIFILGILCVFGLLLILLKINHHEYKLNFNLSDVKSISLFYINEGSKMEISKPNDIETITNSINSLTNVGIYENGIPNGGQSFVVVFHLFDGSDLTCVYFQTFSSTGFFSDGIVQIRVMNMDLLALWQELEYEIIRGLPEESGFSVPSL